MGKGVNPQVEAKRYITDYFLRMTGAEPVTREPRDAMCPSIQLSVQSGLSIILGSGFPHRSHACLRSCAVIKQACFGITKIILLVCSMFRAI